MLDSSSKIHSTEPMTSRYLPDDLAMIEKLAIIFKVRPRTVPRITVRIVFALCSIPYLASVLHEVYVYFVHEAEQKGQSVHEALNSVHTDLIKEDFK